MDPPPTSQTATRAREVSRLRHRSRVGEATLLLGGENTHRNPGRSPEGGKEPAGVRALPAGGGDDHVERGGAESARDLPVRPAALGRLRDLQLTELPETLDLVAESEQGTLLVNGPNRRTGGLRDEEPGGVRADVDDRNTHPSSVWAAASSAGETSS